MPLPLRFARGLLRHAIPVELRDAVLGDFEELYASEATRRGPTRAMLWYWGQTLQSIVACLGGSLTRALDEVWQSSRAACRTLLRERRSTLVSVGGLALAFFVGILVFVHVGHELGFDRYHRGASRIYRVATQLTLGETPNRIASTNAPVGPAMVAAFPEVATSARVRPMGKRLVRHEGRQHYEERLLYADTSIFDLFSFELLRGEPASALATPGSVVITEEMARRYFGIADPLGRRLAIEPGGSFVVTGVVAEPRSSSHFVFDMLCSMATLYDSDRELMEAWNGPFVHYTYVRLRHGADPAAVERQLAGLVETHLRAELAADGSDVRYFLQPLTGIHLGSHLRHELAPNADATLLFVFGAVGVAMLSLASLNLIQLARLRWASRLKQVEARRERVRQFVAESLLQSLTALAIAVIAGYLLLPVLGVWFATDHVALSEGIAAMASGEQLGYGAVPWIVPTFLMLAITIGLGAGCYPMFAAPRRGLPLRPLLLGAQLTVSLFLLIVGGVIVRQGGHLERVALGFDKNDVLVIPIMNRGLRAELPRLEAELKQLPGVVAVGAGSHAPGERPSGGTYHPEGFPPERTAMMDWLAIDGGYLDALGIEIAIGSAIASAPNGEAGVLVNRAAASVFGWQDPIGKSVRRSGAERPHTVVGVVEDFRFSSPHRAVGPIFIEPRESGLRQLFVKIRPSARAATLDALRATWSRLDPGRPFEFATLEQAYDRQFAAERNLGKSFTLFAALAVLITALGLVGVAPARGDGRLLPRCRELVSVSLVANLLVWPAAYLVLRRWLGGFASHVAPEVGIFALASLLMLVVGLLALSTRRLAQGRLSGLTVPDPR